MSGSSDAAGSARHRAADDRMVVRGGGVAVVVVGEGRSASTAGPVTVEDGAGHAQSSRRGHPGIPKTRHVGDDRPAGAV